MLFYSDALTNVRYFSGHTEKTPEKFSSRPRAAGSSGGIQNMDIYPAGLTHLNYLQIKPGRDKEELFQRKEELFRRKEELFQ
jgi:hypothetical protein